MHSLNDLLYVALLIGLWWVKLTYSLFRRTKYLEELCRREQRRRIEEANTIQKRLLEAFLRGPKPTLSELVEDTEAAWSLKHSQLPGAPRGGNNG